MAKIDKFALHVFNHLANNRKISSLLAANTLLSLSKYYTHKKTIRKVNLWALQKRFSRIILSTNVDNDVVESFVPFEKLWDLLTSSLDNYQWRDPELATYSFYNYLKIITIVKDEIKLYDNISFATDHSY